MCTLKASKCFLFLFFTLLLVSLYLLFPPFFTIKQAWASFWFYSILWFGKVTASKPLKFCIILFLCYVLIFVTLQGQKVWYSAVSQLCIMVPGGEAPRFFPLLKKVNCMEIFSWPQLGVARSSAMCETCLRRGGSASHMISHLSKHHLNKF